MNILVIGDENCLDECRMKFGSSHRVEGLTVAIPDTVEVIFDFMQDAGKNRSSLYAHYRNTVFINTTLASLGHIREKGSFTLAQSIFGFAGMPTFLNRECLEVSTSNPAQRDQLATACRLLGTAFEVVEDRIGLVTPRIICMIINEAYSTFQDGTASREDIDVAMKLGTHYPFGPFEWSKKIGIGNVYKLLTALYDETGENRYLVSSALKEEYERS